MPFQGIVKNNDEMCRHKDHTFSAPLIPHFNTKNPSVQHRKPYNFGAELRGFLVWNWGILTKKEWPFCVELMFWTEGGVKLRGKKSQHKNESIFESKF